MSDLARGGGQNNNYIIEETDEEDYASWGRIDTLNIKGDIVSMVFFLRRMYYEFESLVRLDLQTDIRYDHR